MHVTVANRDRVASTCVCQAVHIFIDQEEFIIDLFMILLERYDMVLGVHWLQSLGPIWWDFGRTRLYCWRDDHRVVWQGVTIPRGTARVHSLNTDDFVGAAAGVRGCIRHSGRAAPTTLAQSLDTSISRQGAVAVRPYPMSLLFYLLSNGHKWIILRVMWRLVISLQ
jgi:hypothetical protein